MELKNRFERGGAGVYKCESCGKMTRDTGTGARCLRRNRSRAREN